jgi:hypothetical protein
MPVGGGIHAINKAVLTLRNGGLRVDDHSSTMAAASLPAGAPLPIFALVTLCAIPERRNGVAAPTFV